ncbi:hypothetical protein THAOC_29254 [Thalassiosira oceanica]|uniref:BspA family leucine-rich repeat surface protein n=1 Tax=Thalassiosira oceanica TaxID=159749 RepID=K0RCY6_THAOC|nr:hypothetical protein THAOC_29254 [Thalassiosira oceanica]|eukprot:EJK51563.1 hypothetical protein THAOC_29254 [Thalassiosira oceanica]
MNGAVGYVRAIRYEHKDGPNHETDDGLQNAYYVVEFPDSSLPDSLVEGIDRHTVGREVVEVDGVTRNKHPFQNVIVYMRPKDSKHKTPGSELVAFSRVTKLEYLAIGNSCDTIDCTMLYNIGKSNAYYKRRAFLSSLKQKALTTQQLTKHNISLLDKDEVKTYEGAAHAYQPTMLVHKCALVALAIFGSRGVDAENTGLHGTTTSSTELDAPSKAALLAQANAKPGRVRGLKHRNKRSKASKKAKSNSEGPCTTSPVPKGQFRTNEELRLQSGSILNKIALQLATPVRTMIGDWDVSCVASFRSLFRDGVTFGSIPGGDTFNEPINWDTAAMFTGAKAFNQQLPSFDTAKVTNMLGMFDTATAFNQPLTFDTSKVVNMIKMFFQAAAFNQPLSFDASKVTTMEFMFWGAEAFNQDLCNFGEYFDQLRPYYMFENSGCSNTSDPVSSNGPWCAVTTCPDP